MNKLKIKIEKAKYCILKLKLSGQSSKQKILCTVLSISQPVLYMQVQCTYRVRGPHK
jgi:hypothetical protein